MIRRGFPDAAERIQELYRNHYTDEAITAVPDEFVDQGALIGPKDRMKKRFRDREDSGLTGLTIRGNEPKLRVMAACEELSPTPSV